MRVGKVIPRYMQQAADVIVGKAVPHDLAFPPPLDEMLIAQRAQVL
jgi:hypothetical protein